MKQLLDTLQRNGLLNADQGELDGHKAGKSPVITGDGHSIYKRSLYRKDGVLYCIVVVEGSKSLLLASDKPIETELSGTPSEVEGVHFHLADLSVENAKRLHSLFPFTAPISLRDKKTTIGCGDRLGLATAGQLHAVAQYDVYPVLAQQSIRELTLTNRDFPQVVKDATFLVFQEGFERGYGADGDHLKTLEDIDVALDAGMPMITLDLTEVMRPEPADWSEEKIDSEFDKLDDSIAQHVLEKYAGKTFKLANSTIVFESLEAKKCALMYWTALEFTKTVDEHLGEKRGDQYDLEVSIDETTTPTLPSHHLFIASELQLRGVSVNSLAPRFIGQFQKGIDYIGKVEEFDIQFRVHCDIARAYGNYKVSIHSGSDKFSVYPSIGKFTQLRLHLKTAGTSWLEAVRVIAQTNPPLFRTMLKKAFEYFPEATKLYYVTTDLDAIKDMSAVSDHDLPEYLEEVNARQLLHITYGGLLTDPEVRPEFFRTLNEHETEHYAALEKHLGKHIALLGAEKLG